MKNKCKHIWRVYSTAICPPTIMMSCAKCNEYGFVQDFTGDEWSKAYHSPSDPYIWKGVGEVLLYDEIKK